MCCELHSNLVSLHSETTHSFYGVSNNQLWITFKSCIFAFWNNLIWNSMCTRLSCELHSNLVSLHSETTFYYTLIQWSSCELHSNLVSLHSETTRKSKKNTLPQLWITFKSCIFAFWNNYDVWYYSDLIVVNYIQILYLCILKQLVVWYKILHWCCELHSNLVSLHSETTCRERLHLLWCCELHSNLVSLHSETTTMQNLLRIFQLWITFKSCIFAFWNNPVFFNMSILIVVNYIQILYLCILKQPDILRREKQSVVNYIQILYLCILKQRPY